MEHEGLYVSRKDLRRYELLRMVQDGTLSQVTEALGVSYRQAKRLKAKVEAQGLAGLCHGNRGRPPHNRSEETLRARVA